VFILYNFELLLSLIITHRFDYDDLENVIPDFSNDGFYVSSCDPDYEDDKNFFLAAGQVRSLPSGNIETLTIRNKKGVQQFRDV
jgi:hypothetical protein